LFDLLWICCTTNCTTKSTTNSQQIKQVEFGLCLLSSAHIKLHLYYSVLHKSSQSLFIFIGVATSGGYTNGTPLSITVCVSALGATGALARARAWCRTGSRSPAVGVRSECHSQIFFWNLRHKFLRSGTLSVKKIKLRKCKIPHIFIPGCITCTQRRVTLKWHNWRPGQDYHGTRDRGARKRDVPAKMGRVATLIFIHDDV